MSEQKAFAKAHELFARFESMRTAIIYTLDGCCIIAACALAFLLRFEFSIPPAYAGLLILALTVWPIGKLVAFRVVGLHGRSWRYFSIRDLFLLAFANALGSVIAFSSILAINGSFPRSIWIMDFFLCLPATGVLRLAARLLPAVAGSQPSATAQERTLIYGAGNAGVALLRETRQNSSLRYRVCGFVDDAPEKQRLTIQGVRVLGRGAELPGIVLKRAIDLVLIAIPSASGPQMSRILEHCHSAKLPFKTVPGLAEIIRDNGLAHQIREVAVDDLLGRSPVRLEQDRISAKIQDSTVLVTGAAGSIGSELCRQIARFHPAMIVAYEIAESPLFQLELEMARSFPYVPFYPEIGSVQNSQRLSEVFERHKPSIVYHAAAYKHVPLMEAHAFEAIENNVLGTLNVALAAAGHEVEDFVMISSDKAVRPTNIMGATKRLAELVIRSLQNGGVKFVSVRFGNVLGSNGSVVPIFKDQIARGGPVTVTHPEMRRYFMTIPEACQLVLQSSTMGHGGEIFVLDMGEPVRIVDLARNLILLSGLRPDEDIKIHFTGIRPGEKLYEELNTLEEDTLPTYHEKIKIFAGTTIPWPAMEDHLSRIQGLCATRDLNELVLALKDIIPEYNPSTELLRRVLRKPFAPVVTLSLVPQQRGG